MRAIYKLCIAAVVAVVFGLGASTWASAGAGQSPAALLPTSDASPTPTRYATPTPSSTPSASTTPSPTPTPSQTPTPTPTVPVVPVPALFSAEPTPPTCETPGSFDFEDTFPNVSVTVTPAYNGPGTYTLTITAENGATFPDGTTTKTRVITVLAAVGYQSTNPDAPCYRAPTPTPTPTVPVVPIPALCSAEPTPPTCDTPGSFDFEDTFPNVSVTVTPAYDGPGTYTLTITAENGATFPDGTTTKTRVITVLDALGYQSTNPQAPCYRAPPPTPTPTVTSTPTPTPTATPTPTPTPTATPSPSPTALDVGVLQPICDNDVPRLRYEISVPGITADTVTITWLNPDGPNVVYADQPLSGAVLWPGAVPGPDGRGIDWPGWRQLADGTWVEGDEFDWVRPSVQVLFQVNPEATVTVSYPPSSPNCLTNPPLSEVLGPPPLSETGSNVGPMLGTAAALAILGTGLLATLAWFRRRGADGI
jgi:hypothetical protein